MKEYGIQYVQGRFLKFKDTLTLIIFGRVFWGLGCLSLQCVYGCMYVLYVERRNLNNFLPSFLLFLLLLLLHETGECIVTFVRYRPRRRRRRGRPSNDQSEWKREGEGEDERKLVTESRKKRERERRGVKSFKEDLRKEVRIVVL